VVSRFAFAVVLALGTASCAGASATKSPTTASLPAFATRLFVPPVGATLDLRADGTMLDAKSGDLLGRVEGDRIVDPTGAPLLTVSPNGEVHTTGQTKPFGRFDSDDTFLMSGLDWPKVVGQIRVDDEGHVHAYGGIFILGAARFEPFTPSARRTAEAIYLYVLLRPRTDK
jgi:hypothetical protein